VVVVVSAAVDMWMVSVCALSVIAWFFGVFFCGREEERTVVLVVCRLAPLVCLYSYSHPSQASLFLRSFCNQFLSVSLSVCVVGTQQLSL
jgi:uncharacterized membrane protein